MAYNDLREWIAALDKAGELKRIKAEVDPVLEVTEITDRVSKWGARNGKGPGGPALLFENVKGHPGHKIFINQFGSERRINLALGSDSLDEIAERIHQMMDVKTPQGLLEKIKMLPKLAELGNLFPKRVSTGPCKEVIKRDNFSLLDFPILQCWPQDGGRFITLPCVMTRDPRTGKRNIGMYRMHVYDATSTGMHWQRHKNAAEHQRELMRAAVADGPTLGKTSSVDIMARSGGGSIAIQGKPVGGRMEVAVAIGTDPTLTFSAIVPAPPDIEEYMIAGFLRGKPIEVVKCETVDLEVPASAEIVLEGYIDIGEMKVEGPFGDHTGFYSLEDLYPVFHVQCITHRKNPIYAATVVGKPPQEDAWMALAVERIFLPAAKMMIPELVDFHLPPEGVAHNLMIISIRKSYPGQARKVMNAIWSMGQAMFTKCIVVVDEDCDVKDLREVTLRALNNIDPERDIQFMLGPVDTLDHASRLPNFGSKMGIDATRKWSTEGFDRPWPDEVEMSAEVKERISRRWKEFGLE